MDVPIERYQYYLELAYTTKPAGANTLRPRLFSEEMTLRNLGRGGSVGNVAKNNASHGYRDSGIGTYTSEQLANVVRQLITFYDDSLRWVKWAIANPPLNPPAWWPVQPPNGPNGAPPDFDPAVYAHMTWKLQPVPEYQVDLTDLRLHPVLSGDGGQVLSW